MSDKVDQFKNRVKKERSDRVITTEELVNKAAKKLKLDKKNKQYFLSQCCEHYLFILTTFFFK